MPDTRNSESQTNHLVLQPVSKNNLQIHTSETTNSQHGSDTLPGMVNTAKLTPRQQRRELAKKNQLPIEKSNLLEVRNSLSKRSSLKQQPITSRSSKSVSKSVRFAPTVDVYEIKKEEPDSLVEFKNAIFSSIQFAFYALKGMHPRTYSAYSDAIEAILSQKDNNHKLLDIMILAKIKVAKKVIRNSFWSSLCCNACSINSAQKDFEKFYKAIANIDIEKISEEADRELNQAFHSISFKASRLHMQYLAMLADSSALSKLK